MQHAIIRKFSIGSHTRHSVDIINISFCCFWTPSNLQICIINPHEALPSPVGVHQVIHQVLVIPVTTDPQCASTARVPRMTATARFHRREIAHVCMVRRKFLQPPRACVVDLSSILTYKHPVHLPPARAPCRGWLFPRALQTLQA